MRIAVILVTFNRLSCLKIALQKYEEQTVLPEYILVVDNASSDGTKEFLDEWKEKKSEITKIVIHNSENTGGSGGFDTGVREGIKLDVDYLFLADDDAYAEPDMLEKLKSGYEKVKDKHPAALCTAIYNGDTHEFMHRCRIHKSLVNVKFVGMPEEYYKKDYFRVDILTFVGACISKKVAQKIGCIKTQYFIYFDDAEYCMRIRKLGNIFCIPSSIMHHDVGHDRRISWKDYYDTRNWLDLVKNYFPEKYFMGEKVRMYVKRCSILAKIVRGRDRAHRRMCLDAINDANHGKLGLHPVYRPGSEI